MTLTLPGTEHSVRLARQCAGLTLPGVGCLPSVVADAEAVLSELAGNAIRHTASGGPHGEFSVEIWQKLRDGRAVVLVAVHDQGSAGCPVVRPVSESAEGGRGLLVVAGLAQRWGFTPAGTGCARIVWAELDAGHGHGCPAGDE
ncbi:ATP-binding protein [Nonomuraea longicatena]|uniref:Histidine kinase/HSP90-like ATPase domain-containing protein n=1 Tax=Nonomuraea longicatena TaxID=83682 RepID=A0ABN1P2B1_9ACTN